MGKRSEIDLDTFKLWLRDEQNLHPRSVAAYASNTRRVIEGLDDMSKTDVTRFFDAVHAEQDYKYSNYRAAWKRYVQWAKEQRSVSLPMPSKAGAFETCLPLKVRAVLVYMGSSARMGFDGANIKPGELSRLRWNQVQEAHGGTRCSVITSLEITGRRYEVPKEMLAVLKSWVGPRNDDAALFSKDSRQNVPYAPNELKRELIEGRKEFRRDGFPQFLQGE